MQIIKIAEESIDTLFSKLNSTIEGLTDSEANNRLIQFGTNELAHKSKRSPVITFLNYFKDPLCIILLVAAAISAATGEIRSAVVIFSMVLLSVILNFYQEHKSNKAAEQIAKRLEIRCQVRRNNQERQVLAKEIVPGDILLLSAGSIIPADGKLISCEDFFVNESSLTGESFPIEKSCGDLNNNDTVFSGTNVVSGIATMLAITTGKNTQYGKLADKITEPDETNAFEKGIKQFGILIIKAILIIVLLIFLINAFKNHNIVQSLVFSIAVAVGITPELLPMILSINMAKGSVRMAKHGVLVKRLNSIPDFGSMDILCTDKTGTLTEDRITLVHYVNGEGGVSNDVLRLAYINAKLETGIKNLLDQAIITFHSMDMTNITKKYEVPYDFMRKRSSVIYNEGTAKFMATKGAPEELFKICSHFQINNKILPFTPAQIIKFKTLYEKYSSAGYRVLAVAKKPIDIKKIAFEKADEINMVFQGFIAFFDPPKQSAKETLVFMKQHGVEIKILTGDSPLVTKKICEELDLPIKGILTGEDIDINNMLDDAIAEKALNATILARLSPAQKERVITALRKRNLVIGYLGDGINDVPSLKAADVGISVNNAVDIAKETADIILMQKGLGELMDGVLEGRKTFGNTMKYVMMGLSSNFGNMFSMIGAALYLPFFPMLPGQILLNNFLYDFSQIAIPSDTVDGEYLSKPKHWDIFFIRNFMVIFGPISSLFDFMTFFLLFKIFGLHDGAFQAGWFIESLATQTLVIFIIRTRKIPFIESQPSKYLVITAIAVLLSSLLLIQPIFANLFGFEPLSLQVVIVIYLLVGIYLCIVELAKQFFYHRLYPKDRM